MSPPFLLQAARATPAMIVGVLVTALAAQGAVPIPGSPVPQSLQTLAVVVVGGALGPRRGALALLVYLAVGAAGLPVFADGAAGLQRLWGPTGGYLVGFVAAAWVAGWWSGRGWGRTFPGLVVGMAAAHGVILALGWVRLAWLLGPGEALAQGVAPFLWGGAVKSLAAAAILTAWGCWGVGRRLARAERLDAPEPVEPGPPEV